MKLDLTELKLVSNFKNVMTFKGESENFWRVTSFRGSKGTYERNRLIFCIWKEIVLNPLMPKIKRA